jgi:hypothetical protein
VLIDKHGSLHIELYALKQLLQPESHTPRDILVDREIRSIARLAYTALTGTIEVPDPYLEASRLNPRVPERWNRWLDYALDHSRGFESAQQALHHLPAAGAPLPADRTRATPNTQPNTKPRRTPFAALAPWRAKSD